MLAGLQPASAGAPAFALTKSHSGNFTEGQPGDYTISLANTGDGPTSGTITIVDTLPAGLTFEAGTGTNWTCSAAGQVVTCTSTTVLPAMTVDPSIDIGVLVTATSPGTVTNTATASGGGSTNTATANDPTTILPSPPTLAIAKSHTGSFTVGATGSYTIVPSNTGGTATSGTVTVVDNLPTGLTYNSASGTGWTCSASGQAVTCTSSAVIAAGGTGTSITVNVNVLASAVPSVTNSASASGGGASNTPTATDPTTVNGAPALTAQKSHTGNFVIGINNTYTLSVKNSGTSATTGTLTYVDTLPAGLTYVSASGTGWTCSASGQVVTCTTTTAIAAGATSAAITLTVNVVGPAGSVTNSATASGGGASSSSTVTNPTTIVNNAPAASGSKSHVGNFTVGINGVYTITPKNTGVLASSGTVTVTDTLPTGLTYVSATGTDWTCGAAGQVVTCTSPDVIAAGANGNPITLTVAVGLAAFPSVTNSAVISFNSTSFTASNPTQVDNGPRLVASKSHTGNFTDGTNGVYTLGVSNTGSTPTTSAITITDTLHAGLTFISGTGTDWSCSAAGQVVTCTTSDVLAVGGVANPITLTVGVGPAAVGTFNNVAVPSGGGAAFYVNATNSTTVNGVARLALTKTHTGTFYAGLQGVYYLTPSNSGSAATSGTVTLVDTLPAGLSYVAASGVGWSCSAAGLIVTCTSPVAIGAGANGNQVTLTVLPSQSAVPSVTNSATLTGGNAVSTGSASDPTTVAVAPVLGVSKTHTGNFVAGQNGTYTITTVNSGYAATSGTYTVVDTLPAGLTYVSATGTGGFTCSDAGQVVTCTSSTVIPATSIGGAITLVVGVAASTVPTVTNTVTSSGGGAPNTGSSTDVTTVTIPVLAIAKSHTGNFVAGQSGTYTIAVSNTGNATTFGTTTMTDTLPAGMTYASASGTGWTCGAAGQVVTCTSTAAIAGSGGAFPSIALNVTIPSTTAPGTLTNTAGASGGGAVNTPSANDPTTIVQPQLAIAKTHTGSFPVGGSGSYTIAVSNTGNATTFGTTTVVDTLPAGLLYASASGSGWTCGDAGQVVTCTSTAAIAGSGGAFPAITLGVTVPSTTAPGTLTNSATGSGGGAPNSPTATDPTTISGAPSLTIAKSHTGNFVAGATGTYTIAVGNSGNVATSGTVTVVDTLPTGLTYNAASGTGWTCGDAGATVTCTSTTSIAASGAGNPISLTVNVLASAAASVTNSATASGGGATNTPVATDPTTIVRPVLAIAKSHTGTFTAGSSGTYTIAVSNTGTSPTTGTLTVVDTLPTGLTYNAASGTGWTCSDAGATVTCTSTTSIAAGSPGNPISLTVNVLASAPASVTNSANASGGGASNVPVATDPTTIVQPVLAITKSHTGNFTVGSTGTYTIAVSNTGTAPTTGTLTVVDTLPTGLTYNAASGTGWTCSDAGATVTCTSTASIAAGSPGNPIALTVNAVGPPGTVTNSVTVSGGGASNTPVATDPTTLGGAPTLAIAKSHTGNFTAGAAGTYSIVVSNTGNVATSGTITVVDTLPTGLTYNAASGTGWTCGDAGATVTCTSTTSIAAASAGNPIALTVNVLASAPASVTNSANASGGGAANTPVATDPTTIVRPILAIAKTHAGNFTIGSTGTYTIAVSNTGSAPTTGTLTVVDTLPAGLTYNAASGTGWTCGDAGAIVTCTGTTSIAAGGAGNPISLTVNAIGPAGTVTNSVTVSGGGASNAPVATDPTMLVGTPVLAIAKSHTGNFTAGATGTYTIAVSNTGTVATSGTVTVVDTLPTGLTYNAASGTGWSCSDAGANVTCTSTTSIAAASSAAPIALTVNVLASVPATVTNSATASGGGATNTPVATDPTTIVRPVLAVTKTHTGSFAIGTTGTYTIAVSNTGSAPTSGTITIVDTLPTGLTYNTASGTGWTCSGSAGSATCTSTTSIAAGAAGAPIALTVNAVGPPGSVVNSVTASGGGANNTPVATDPTIVTGSPLLAIAKSHTGNFTAGVPGTYTIVVSNTGNLATSGTITVSDPLPAGLTYSSASGSGWTCTDAGATITCTSTAAITPGGKSTPITVTVNVLAAAIPAVTNTATGSGGGATNTPTASDPTVVGGTPSITGLTGAQIDKFVNTVRSITAAPGASVTYTIGFINTGTAAATNVVVSDPFPAGVTPNLSTVTLNGSTSGFTASLSGQTLTVTIASVPLSVPQTISIGATVSSAITTGQTSVNVGNVSATGIAALTTSPATIFTGSSNIVYDGTKGGSAPIAGATIALVDPVSGKPIAVSNNPQSTGTSGAFSFVLSPAQFGAPGGTKTYNLTLSAPKYRNRTIQAAFTAEPSGLLYSVTLTALDGAPLAIEGGFTLVTRPTTISNVLNLINNIPMFPVGAIEVQKVANRSTVSVGDSVIYTVTITASQNFGATRIVDELPAGLAYAPGSATFDGAALTPSVSGLTQIWELPALSQGTHALRYAVVVGPTAGQNTKLTNTVDVTASVPGGGTASGSAQATVQTIAGAFSDRLTILGRVIVGSADGGWTSVKHGVAGVRIIMEDGTTVVTDAQGRYSFQEVRPGAHVLRLDTSSLPPGIVASATHAYNDPRSTVRLVHTLMDTRLIQDVIFVVEEQQ